jgi:hypothetical protein
MTSESGKYPKLQVIPWLKEFNSENTSYSTKTVGLA